MISLGVNNCDGLWYVNHFMAVSGLDLEKQNVATKTKNYQIFVSQIKINFSIGILNASNGNTNTVIAWEAAPSFPIVLKRKHFLGRWRWLCVCFGLFFLSFCCVYLFAYLLLFASLILSICCVCLFQSIYVCLFLLVCVCLTVSFHFVLIFFCLSVKVFVFVFLCAKR